MVIKKEKNKNRGADTKTETRNKKEKKNDSAESYVKDTMENDMAPIMFDIFKELDEAEKNSWYS